MAGFFGLFDYSRPGPGISKNAPQKKGFVVFFEIYARKFWKLMVANLLFALVSLPVVTSGLANVGLTFVTRNFAREKHAFIPEDFFDRIKKNWKQALLVGIINLIFDALIAFGVYFYVLQAVYGKSLIYFIGIALILAIALIYTFMKYYIYMLMITFKLSIKQIYKNSIILSLTGFKRNILISFVLALFYGLGVLLLFINTGIGILLNILAYVLVFPAFRSLLIQFTVFPTVKKYMIDPYYKEHPNEDIEAKRSLNIGEESEEDEEERIFEDTGVTKDTKSESEPKIPRQYTNSEMERIRRKQKRNEDSDDDGTI